MEIRRDRINHGFVIEKMEAPYKSVQVFNRNFRWTMKKHAHPFYQIIYVTSGSLCVYSDNNKWIVLPGQAHILPEGRFHQLSTSGYEQMGIDLQPNQVMRSILPLYKDYITEPVVVNCPELLSTVSEISEKVQIGNRISNALVLALLDTIVLRLLEARTRIGSERFDQRLSNYINANLGNKLNLKKVAERFHVSTPHLERLSRKHFGCGVMSLYNQRRLSQACILLQSTNLRVSEIADKLAFSAPSHFSAFFRQRMGLSPSDYRSTSGEIHTYD